MGIQKEVDETITRAYATIRIITNWFENGIITEELYQEKVKVQKDIIKLARKVLNIHLNI